VYGGDGVVGLPPAAGYGDSIGALVEGEVAGRVEFGGHKGYILDQRHCLHLLPFIEKR